MRLSWTRLFRVPHPSTLQEARGRLERGKEPLQHEEVEAEGQVPEDRIQADAQEAHEPEGPAGHERGQGLRRKQQDNNPRPGPTYVVSASAPPQTTRLASSAPSPLLSMILGPTTYLDEERVEEPEAQQEGVAQRHQRRSPGEPHETW